MRSITTVYLVATALVGAVATSGLTSMATAGETTWIGPDGGQFDAPRNWSDGVPTGADTALFLEDSTTAISVSSTSVANRLIVRNGHIIFAITDSLIALSSSVVTPSIMVADVANSIASATVESGVLAGGHAFVGAAGGSDGTLTISEEATLLLDSTLIVGSSGHGAIEVDGELLALSVQLGTSASGDGTAFVEGGTIGIGFTTLVGSFGVGALDLSDGGTLLTNELLIGLNALSMGNVNVVGAGSAVATTQKLRVAHGGNAQLVIADGGSVHVGTELVVALLPAGFLFPFHPPSFGRIVIDGDGSQLQVDGLMRLTGLGIAELEIHAGGSLGVGSNLFIERPESTSITLGIGGARADGPAMIDVGDAFAPAAAETLPYSLTIVADETDPPTAGQSFVLVEASSIVPPESALLPTVPGLVADLSLVAVDDRWRLVVSFLGGADLNGDGVVDGADLGELLSQWGPCDGCSADLNGDGVVDGADLGILLSNWTVTP